MRRLPALVLCAMLAITPLATGCVTGVREHVVNLEIGLKLRDALESLGATVYMTRETADVDISNQERAIMMNDLGVNYSDKYTGLNWSTVPSMLMELGYMSNPTEDRLLVQGEYQDKLVRGMVNGICDYMGREIPYK